jgi:hypothetical protein
LIQIYTNTDYCLVAFCTSIITTRKENDGKRKLSFDYIEQAKEAYAIPDTSFADEAVMVFERFKFAVVSVMLVQYTWYLYSKCPSNCFVRTWYKTACTAHLFSHLPFHTSLLTPLFSHLSSHLWHYPLLTPLFSVFTPLLSHLYSLFSHLSSLAGDAEYSHDGRGTGEDSTRLACTSGE